MDDVSLPEGQCIVGENWSKNIIMFHKFMAVKDCMIDNDREKLYYLRHRKISKLVKRNCDISI